MARQSVGEFLATLRRAHGYTQQDVADRLSVSNRTVSSWETGNAMPDIVLLPAIAELYNVTVDEILKGERIESEEPLPKFSPKAQASIYKRKQAQFTWQTYALLCVFIAGFITSYIAMVMAKFTVLIAGSIIVLISIVNFVALCISTEHIIDNSEEVGRKSCVLLRRQMSICAYLAGTVATIAQVINFGMIYFDVIKGVTFSVIFIPIAVILFVAGWLINANTIKRYGTDQMRADNKANRKLAGKIALFGVIPIVIAITLMVIFNSVTPTVTTTVYENQDKEAFREHLESYVVQENSLFITIFEMEPGEYKFELTEWSQTAPRGEMIKIDATTIVEYRHGLCNVYFGDVSQTARRYVLNDFVVYNLRYSDLDRLSSDWVSEIMRIHHTYKLQARGEGLALVRISEYDIGGLMYIVGVTMIVADCAIGAIIYLVKKKVGKIKL